MRTVFFILFIAVSFPAYSAEITCSNAKSEFLRLMSVEQKTNQELADMKKALKLMSACWMFGH